MNAQSFGAFRSVEFVIFRVAGHCRIRSSMRSCALPDELTIEVVQLIEINHHVASYGYESPFLPKITVFQR